MSPTPPESPTPAADPTPATSAIAAVAAAYGESLSAFARLGDELGEGDWAAPTQCPLWSVADIYAHIIGPEEWIAEGAAPYDGPTQEWLDTHVAARRGHIPRRADGRSACRHRRTP